MIELSADIADRVARARAAMRERGLGSLLVFGSGQHNMLRTDQVFYLTDFRSIGPSLVLVPASGTPTLLTAPVWDARRAEETAVGVDVVGVDAADLVARAAELARSFDRPIGVGGRPVMPIAYADQMAERFGEDLVDADKLVPSLATKRTPVELERVERAAAIADEGFRHLCDVAEPGLWEYELTAELDAAMAAAGSEDNFGLMAAGAHNVAIRAPRDRKIEKGDLIVGEITPCYRGYLAQLCRTLVLGEPSDLQREKYDMLIEAQRRGFEVARPGRSSAEIAKAANDVIGAAGYAEYCRPPYMRTRGHGLGMGGVVPYDINEQSPVTLEEQMTMVIHPNQYLPDTGYMMLGDTVVIEADGPRRLTRTPIQLFWKAV